MPGSTRTESPPVNLPGYIVKEKPYHCCGSSRACPLIKVQRWTDSIFGWLRQNREH